MFPISYCKSLPQVDTMPVLKTTNYPFAKGSFKPLLYARAAAVCGEGLFFDLMSFERDPVVSAKSDSGDIFNDSCAALSFNCFPKTGDVILSVVANAAGLIRCFETAPGKPPHSIECATSAETYAGQDEQGWYWGVRFFLSPSLLGEIFGQSEFSAGNKLRGNIFTFYQPGPNSYFGAIGPAQTQDIFDPGNLADFIIVDY